MTRKIDCDNALTLGTGSWLSAVALFVVARGHSVVDIEGRLVTIR